MSSLILTTDCPGCDDETCARKVLESLTDQSILVIEYQCANCGLIMHDKYKFKDRQTFTLGATDRSDTEASK